MNCTVNRPLSGTGDVWTFFSCALDSKCPYQGERIAITAVGVGAIILAVWAIKRKR